MHPACASLLLTNHPPSSIARLTSAQCLTPTFKLRRQFLLQRYMKDLQALYTVRHLLAAPSLACNARLCFAPCSLHARVHGCGVCAQKHGEPDKEGEKWTAWCGLCF